MAAWFARFFMRARENENETRLEIPKFYEKQFYQKDGIFYDIKKIVSEDKS